MNTHANKKPSIKTSHWESSAGNSHSNGETATPIENLRSDALAQRKLIEKVSESLQQSPRKTIQQKAKPNPLPSTHPSTEQESSAENPTPSLPKINPAQLQANPADGDQIPVQRVKVGTQNVTLSGSMPQWVQDGLTYHINLTTDPPHVTCEDWPVPGKGKKKGTTTKMHFFYRNGSNGIVDATSGQKGKKKFSQLPTDVKNFISANYQAILAVK